MPESRDPDYLSFYAPCLPGSPLLPKQALSSHSTIEAPNALLIYLLIFLLPVIIKIYLSPWLPID